MLDSCPGSIFHVQLFLLLINHNSEGGILSTDFEMCCYSFLNSSVVETPEQIWLGLFKCLESSMFQDKATSNLRGFF